MPLLDAATIRPYLDGGDFRRLFTQRLGWNTGIGAALPITVDGVTYALQPIAEKAHFAIYRCPPGPDGALPNSSIRAKIDNRVTRLQQLHLIIYANQAGGEQVWQWVRRDLGTRAARREQRYERGGNLAPLLRALNELVFTLEQEERGIGSVDVSGRVRAAFDVEKVTKRFYERFRAELDAFTGFVEGIQALDADRAWYASLMLNRLMFVYFIQKRGFLDGDLDYLRHRLEAMQAQAGRDQFLSFYRHFLLRLFHEGLDQPKATRAADLDALLGNVPYLNGGLFDVHTLEQRYPAIAIPDEAFSRVFDFFDAYQWQLDERPRRDEDEINPDVLGYIFEKYINQKQMGAYYTKEDITEYIAKNTVIPHLFQAAEQQCEIAFQPGSALWRLLQDAPDRYIYAAVQQGVDDPLPPEIAAGVQDVSRREGWNRPATEPFALPTETWREHVARRTRCLELRDTLQAGAVQRIDDLITHNLDIRRFAQDAIENCEGPELLRAFYQAITTVSVLDPTCGSGAFLFAALNILEPLYEACLERMRGFVDDAGRLRQGEQRYRDFRRTLQAAQAHPNQRYFILKSIILNNLYGVDIMEEAVEICKLRLFLKLAAQVERSEQVEPLPDIDFNIRAGNTLVGYATAEEVRRAIGGGRQLRMDFDDTMPRLNARLAETQHQFAAFRTLQTDLGEPGLLAGAKAALRDKLTTLSAELDGYLAAEYGISADQKDFAPRFATWRTSHQPFHWLVEFYGVMDKGGFDVVIGNPPYVEYSKVRSLYTLRGFTTGKCGNLYAYVVERSYRTLRPAGWMGMIVPLSLTFATDFASLRAMILTESTYLHLSSYDNIPDRLFTGAKESENTSKANQQRITIFISGRGTGRSIHSTSLLRWKAVERPYLFSVLPTAEVTGLCTENTFPKVGSVKMRDFLARWEASPARLGSLVSPRGTYSLVVPKTASYYIAAYPEEMDRSQQASYRFDSTRDQALAMTLLNSNAYFWLWRVYGDSFHVTHGWVMGCPLFKPLDDEFIGIASALRSVIPECAVFKGYRGVDVPNVNFNRRMDILWRADEWVIRHIAPDLDVTPSDFLWGKSNSFLKLDVPKSANYPLGVDARPPDDEY